MNILEEHGLFWWHTEAVPAEHFAPEASIAGHLTVRDDGSATLDLNGMMPGEAHPLTALFNPETSEGRSIQGILKVSGKYVLLTGLNRSGGQFKGHGISYYKFQARNCLVGSGLFVQGDPLFGGLDVELAGMDEWMWLDAFKTEQTNTGLSITYTNPKNFEYRIGDGTLAIDFAYEGTEGGSKVDLREVATAKFTPDAPYALPAAQNEYERLEELLVLLTGAEYKLPWPTLRRQDGRDCTYYFHRTTKNSATPKYNDVWTRFVEISEHFGEMYSTWKAKREQFGPAFYLYLGTRRGMALFIENRFANLAWGIEAFDRVRRGDAVSASETERIARILALVSDAKDKTWLKGRLRNAGEPNLEARLFDTIATLSLDLEKRLLRDFAIKCSKYRNELSHFGGRRDRTNYNDFMLELYRLSDALSELYHALILREIGVEAEIVQRRFRDDFTTTTKLRLAGLLPPPAPPKKKP